MCGVSCRAHRSLHAIRRSGLEALMSPEMASENPGAAAGGAESAEAGKLNKLFDKWEAEEG